MRQLCYKVDHRVSGFVSTGSSVHLGLSVRRDLLKWFLYIVEMYKQLQKLRIYN